MAKDIAEGTETAEPTNRHAATAKLQLLDVGKEFRTKRANTLALSGIDLTIRDGEFVSVIGRSGCGKTTLLRMLAGLLSPSSGRILVEGRSLWEGGRADTSVMSRLG
ncbi:ATP-binding cassette domain-containing protein, partial [Actinomadura adrarensis]